MDSAVVESVDPSVGDKRSPENDCDERLLKKKKKKARFDVSGDMKRVAEIVLVLSTLGKMRSGRNPTVGEKNLMAEAREKLAEMCETIAPKDILPMDAGRVLIEDLGLNRLSNQKLGFLPSKMSIADKLLLSKKKMEESKKFATQSATYSSQLLKVEFASKPEIHGTLLHATPRIMPNEPRPTAVSVGGLQAAFPMVHVSPLTSTASNKLHVSETRPTMVSKGLPSSSVGKDSSSLTLFKETAHFKVDGTAYASQIQAKSSGPHLLEKAPSFSSKFQSGIVARVAETERIPDHNPFNVKGTLEKGLSQIARDQNSKPSVIHTAYGNLQSVHQPSQDINLAQASSLSDNHRDAARNVQKFLQQKLPEHPSWTPPSTDYMNKSLACQICKVSIKNIESLLVCDGCEKGVHLKCLQSYYQQPIPKGEWHCPQCLISNCGKPLPSKYGRVAKNISAQKVPLNSSGIHASSGIKAEKPDSNVIHQNVTANGITVSVNSAHIGITGSKSASDMMMPTARQMQGDKLSTSRMNVLKEITGVVCVPHSGKPNECSNSNHIQTSEPSPCASKRLTTDPKTLPKLKPCSACPETVTYTGIDTYPSSHPLCNSPNVDKEGVPKCADVSTDQEVTTFPKLGPCSACPETKSYTGIDTCPSSHFSCNSQDVDKEVPKCAEFSTNQCQEVTTLPNSACPETISYTGIDACPSSHSLCNSQDVDKEEVPKCAEVSIKQCQEVTTLPNSASPEISYTGIDTCPSSYSLCNSQDVDKEEPKCAEVSTNQCQEVTTFDFRETSKCYPGSCVKQDDQNDAQNISTETSCVGNGTRDCTSFDGLQSVDWVGDILQVVDEKVFYKSCCINGVVYKLQDHALFHSNNDNVRPSKLQALWENTKTKLKWAIVNCCYMPEDLPEVVIRPCTPENNEVYESNHCSTVRAGLIQGACEVLPPNRFKTESERRIHLAHEPNNGLQPVFLCKWFYDESRGLFQPITD